MVKKEYLDELNKELHKIILKKLPEAKFRVSSGGTTKDGEIFDFYLLKNGKMLSASLMLTNEVLSKNNGELVNILVEQITTKLKESK